MMEGRQMKRSEDRHEMKLNDEVMPKEILKFLNEKYEVPEPFDIVDSRTIRRWIDELGIECVQPRPKRNRDIRYHKEDVLKLEKLKRQSLLNYADKKVKQQKLEEIGETEEKRHIEGLKNYVSNHDVDRMELEENAERIWYENKANEIIQKEMLEMCFNKLFPNVEFDEKELAKSLYVKNNIDQYDSLEYGKAITFLESKSYIKRK